MINEIKKGEYNLIETRSGTKILQLDVKAYVWLIAEGIGEILVSTEREHDVYQRLSVGEYTLYEVKDEPKLTDVQHLELQVGKGKWQGYLLLTGLPTADDKRNRIIPTDEVISS